MTRPRRRHRSHAEEMYWERLSPRERLAFVVGFSVGQGHDFPTPDALRVLAEQLGVTRVRPVPVPRRCRVCRGLIVRRPGQRGRPPTRCESCRGGGGS